MLDSQWCSGCSLFAACVMSVDAIDHNSKGEITGQVNIRRKCGQCSSRLTAHCSN